MKFIGDLHVHSKFSRATSRHLDLENLYVTAQLKGITVVGTGDFTHPGWFSEINAKLVPAEAGLFSLHKDIASVCDQQVPLSCRGPVRFMLQSEISNIYKKDGKTRKNHNLVFVPNLGKAAEFNQKLDRIGNIKSDGRPILGLDARDLLEILLETDDQAYLVPAHIWTPWFSLLGSKSGFETVEACFEDLSDYIFAVETGLSSDPAMNWRVSQLDRMTLISNSDAHSPAKLGREANIFNTDLDYASIKKALVNKGDDAFQGTIEFYPEQGKYHFDGHRKCQIRLNPKETLAEGGRCPVCNKPVTLGVSYRVEMLADREEASKPETSPSFANLVPLVDVLSEILRVGPNSKRVAACYAAALEDLGPELSILREIDRRRLSESGIPFLAEAITRMRAGELDISGGYDGEFGVVRIFSPEERDKLSGQRRLFKLPEKMSVAARQNFPDNAFKERVKKEKRSLQADNNGTASDPVLYLNSEQTRAIEQLSRPLLIVAGPGTGKTLTLTRRIAHQILHQDVNSKHILAVTFTHKAAREMKSRLARLLENTVAIPEVATFHSFCFKLLNQLSPENKIRVINDRDRKITIQEAVHKAKRSGLNVTRDPQYYLKCIIRAKQNILGPEDDISVVTDSCDLGVTSRVYQYYQDIMDIQALCDFEDLIFRVVRLFTADPLFKQDCSARYQYIFIDEYQDINYGQYCIIQALASGGGTICAIGDPDQSIYGFRGSDRSYFNRFVKDFPGARVIGLEKNYRSTKTILKAANQVIERGQSNGNRARTYSETDGAGTLSVIETTSETAEAVVIGKTIEKLMGGTGFHSIDFGSVDPGIDLESSSFADFAVLYRTHSQGKVIDATLTAAGIPCQLVSRESWMDHSRLAELVSLLSVLEGSSNLVDIERIRAAVQPGISRKTAWQLKEWFLKNGLQMKSLRYMVRQFPITGLTEARQKRLYNFLGRIYTLEKEIEQLNVQKKLVHLVENTRLKSMLKEEGDTLDAFNRLLNYAQGFGTDANTFLGELALYRDSDVYRENVEKVSLMTLHAAKGLEFPIVFIAGCDDKRLPYCRGGLPPADPAEERRLFYVALTRAMEKLFLTFANRVKIYGKTEESKLSSFVQDIAKELRHHQTEKILKKQIKSQEQLQLF